MARQLRRSAVGSALTQPAARRPAPLRPVLRPEWGRRGRGLGLFIGEVRAELNKVVWPTRQQAAKLTALTIAISVAVGFLLGGIDYAFAELFRFLLR